MREPFLSDPFAAGNSAAARAPLVEACNLRRAFGARTIVDGVDLTLDAGECLAIFGPNGAGKTTLLRLLAGLLRPTSGSVTIGGERLARSSAARARVGVVSHQHMLYDALTGRENVRFAARLHGVSDSAAVDRALERMGALQYADHPVRSLSRGMQQRVTLARALVHEPAVLLADEPFTALDDMGTRAVAILLEDVRRAGGAIVLVTHNATEGAAAATRVARMQHGRFSEND